MTDSIFKLFKVGDKVRLQGGYEFVIPDSDILEVEEVYYSGSVGSVKVSGIWVFSDMFELVRG